MARKIRIIMIEDHPEYRDIVEMALNEEPDLELINQFGTSERALSNLQGEDALEAPDVILLDLSLPGMSGLDAIPLLNEAAPEAKILILTQSELEGDVIKAVMLGASGYHLKSSTVTQLTYGIRMVTEGGASLDAKVAKFVLKTLQTKLHTSQIALLLTDREVEVLTLLAEGNVKKMIADRLNISPTTVVSHVRNIYEKLNTPNAPSAIAKAFQLGILPINK
jgi:DNA-binding NarL/FixJ family response regulator